MQKPRLIGQVAIVTGASSGVGWQSAVRLGEQGVKLCITARRVEALEQLRAQLTERGIECIVSPGDVTQQSDVDRVVRECLDAYRRVDLLVNCAAVQSYGYFDALPWAQISRIFDTTCFGYMRFARAVLPHFREQKHGHIINVLSMLSEGAAPLLSVYTAAKHALWGWHKSLRLELARSGIAVSGTLIPSVSTPMFDHAPTLLGRAPKPVPPTYDTDVAARSVVRCALHPGIDDVPVFLQGRLLLLVDRLLPQLGRFILSRFGVQMQLRRSSVERPEGNLFRPLPQGTGPYGTVRPTPAWVRSAITAGVAAAALTTLGAAAWGASKLPALAR